jgi:inosine-uridine nucleoside N-ribohydrolase
MTLVDGIHKILVEHWIDRCSEVRCRTTTVALVGVAVAVAVVAVAIVAVVVVVTNVTVTEYTRMIRHGSTIHRVRCQDRIRYCHGCKIGITRTPMTWRFEGNAHGEELVRSKKRRNYRKGWVDKIVVTNS